VHLASGVRDVGHRAGAGDGLREDRHPEFTITWATAAVPSGYAVDVQRKGPAGAYSTILTHTTTLSATQTLARGAYSYRARLVRLSGGATKFSPAATITVS
jgi:hypothetical protein